MRAAAGTGAVLAVTFLASASAAETQTRTITVDGEPRCATCRIEIAERLSLGSMDDSVSPGGLMRGAVAPGGTILIVSDLLSTPGPLMYSGEGRLLGMLGRSGEGPGELRHVSRLATGADEIYLQDGGGVLHVFDERGEFNRVVRGIPVTRSRLAVVDGAFLAVVSGSSRPPEAPDRSVHLYDLETGRHVDAVGPTSHLDPRRPPEPIRVAPSPEGGVWVVRPPVNAALWSLASAAPRVRVTWSPSWLGGVDESYTRSATEEDVVLEMEVWEDPESGLLWVMTLVSQPGAGPVFPDVEPGAPLPTNHFSPGRLRGVLNTIVSVVDLGEGSVLAHLELDAAASYFLKDGRLLVPRENEYGFQWPEVVRLELRR